MRIGPLTIDRVKISLLVALVCITTLPILSEQWIWYSLLCCSALLGIYALWKKAWVDVWLIMIIIASFVFARVRFPETEGTVVMLRTAAILATFFLNVTLLIGPWTRFVKRMRPFYKYRRHVGVTAFLMALTHATLVLSYYFEFSPEAAYASAFVFFGSTSLFIMTWMALTSWDYVQKKVKPLWWSVLHTLLLAGYIGYIAMFMNYVLDLETWHKVVLGIFVVFWLLVSPWALPKKILRRVNGWKQLHVLIYIAYASVIIHIWTGTLKFEDILWLKIVFWAFFALVVGSHVSGLLFMLRQFVKRKKASGETLQLNGKTYYNIGSAAEFPDGKGRRVDANGFSVAIFKHNGKLFGMSTICPHQGGPIAEGCIVNGYVECPWHRYQFSVDTGSGPPGFKDCIPYYEVVEQNGAAYVCVESTGSCGLK